MPICPLQSLIHAARGTHGSEPGWAVPKTVYCWERVMLVRPATASNTQKRLRGCLRAMTAAITPNGTNARSVAADPNP
jgi:hypothetical protein